MDVIVLAAYWVGGQHAAVIVYNRFEARSAVFVRQMYMCEGQFAYDNNAR